FVFALTSRGPIVLMCSDLEMPPVTAIELYCLRVRVETMFAMLKHLLGAFHYHFWSKRLPRHSRKPKKNQHLQQPTTEDVQQVQRCWEGYERFAMLAAIALGLSQLIALKFSPEVWVDTMFAILKHLLGAFHYHFWSKRLPRHSRKPKKNQHLQQPTTEDVQQVQRCWEGYERFAMLAAIALGLSQLIALKFSPEVW